MKRSLEEFYTSLYRKIFSEIRKNSKKIKVGDKSIEVKALIKNLKNYALMANSLEYATDILESFISGDTEIKTVSDIDITETWGLTTATLRIGKITVFVYVDNMFPENELMIIPFVKKPKTPLSPDCFGESLLIKGEKKNASD